MKTLIRNGRIITACDDYVADVLIDGETVAAIGRSLPGPADKVIDATGRLVIPGGIDPHVHMELPFGGTQSSDDFRTGTIAAAFGGTTTIIDFAIQYQGQTLTQAVDNWHAKAHGKCAVDYSFHLAVTRFEEKDAAEARRIMDEGITSFKVFMAYPGVFMIDDGTMYRVLRALADRGGLTLVHAESGAVIEELIRALVAEGRTAPHYHALSRPPVTEADGVQRAVKLAEIARAPAFIVHVSCAEALEPIIAARQKGLPIYGETCVQYLFLSYENYLEEGFNGAKYVMTPPLRDRSNHAVLWQALRQGYLQVISTDHCPFNLKGQKELGLSSFTRIPNGAPGVEDRMVMTYQGAVLDQGFSLNRWVEITSTASARMFGLYPRKGTIAVGSDADIVIFDPDREQVRSASTHHMNCDYNCYEGMKVRGCVETVLLRGKTIVEHDRYLGRPGEGQFLRRGACVQW